MCSCSIPAHAQVVVSLSYSGAEASLLATAEETAQWAKLEAVEKEESRLEEVVREVARLGSAPFQVSASRGGLRRWVKPNIFNPA